MFKKLTFAVLILCLTFSSTAVLAADSVSSSNIKSFTTNSLIKNDGSLWLWGGSQSVPTQLTSIVDVDSQVGEFLIQKDQSIRYLNRSLSLYQSTATTVPVTGINHISDYVLAYNSDQYTYIAIDQDGKVYKAETPREFSEISFSIISDIDDVTAITEYYESDENYSRSGRVLILLKKDGTVWKMSKFSDSIQQIQGLEQVVQILDNYALKDDGTVWAWSDKIQTVTKASQVNGLPQIKTLIPARYGFLAIDKQNNLWFNGSTVTGYSDGTAYHEQPKPIKLTSISNVLDAAVVERSLLVLTNDHKLYSTSVELEAMPASPKFELLSTNIKEMQADYRHAIMQKNDGTLWGWGVNKDAQLGYGDYEFSYDKLVPVQQAIAVQLNGETLALSNGVVTRENQSYVPLRSMFEKLGAVVEWNNDTKIATITRKEGDQVTVQLKINTKNETIEFNNKQVSNKPFSVNGTSYLPLRFISESLGAKVDWNQKAEMISITMQ